MIDIEFSFDVSQWERYYKGAVENLNLLPYVLDARLRQTMEAAVEMAKMLCPVDTGRLRDSIRMEGGFMNYMLIADAKNPSTGDPYAGYVEGGTMYMAPRPFMRPAIDAAMSTIMENVAGDVRQLVGVREVWSGVGAVSVIREAATGRIVTWKKA